MIALLAIACVPTGWDDTRRDESAPIVLSADDREAEVSFVAEAMVVLEASDGGDTDTGTWDTGWDEGTGVSVDLVVDVTRVEGTGRVRFLPWGAASTDVVPEPVDFGADEEPVVYDGGFFCPAETPICEFGQRATLDLRDGGPVTVTLRVRATASADSDSRQYISDASTLDVAFR